MYLISEVQENVKNEIFFFKKIQAPELKKLTWNIQM